MYTVVKLTFQSPRSYDLGTPMKPLTAGEQPAVLLVVSGAFLGGKN